jgi:pimeloyl-ACP methyl ester carboxylesterase
MGVVERPMLSSRRIALTHGPELEVLQGGEGPPLVWLHGPRRPDADDAVLRALCDRFSVTAPLQPGQNSLSELDDLPTIHDLVLFYDSALEALGLNEVTLAGHSFGGMLAAELAAHAPGRVGRLVLLSPLGLWNDAHPVEDMFARPYPEIEALIWSGAERRPPAPTPEEGVEALIAIANALGSVAKYVWPIPDRGLRGRLYRITAPTLLVFAKADALVPPAYAADFAEGLARSSAELAPGSHMFAYEDPEAMAELIEGFVDA